EVQELQHRLRVGTGQPSGFGHPLALRTSPACSVSRPRSPVQPFSILLVLLVLVVKVVVVQVFVVLVLFGRRRLVLVQSLLVHGLSLRKDVWGRWMLLLSDQPANLGHTHLVEAGASAATVGRRGPNGCAD